MHKQSVMTMHERRIRAREIFQSGGLYCLTDAKLSRGRDNITIVEQMLNAGIRIIQYREKDLSRLAMYQECMVIRGLTRRVGATFIVNDDIALALAVGADGIHVGQDDLPVPVVRQLVGESMLIGLSTHSPEQVQAAVADGADYLGVGPVYSTQTKKDVGAPVGLPFVQHVACNTDLAFVAIGGIHAENVSEVVRCGADCVAMISDIVSAPDIGQQIRLIQAEILSGKRLRG